VVWTENERLTVHTIKIVEIGPKFRVRPTGAVEIEVKDEQNRKFDITIPGIVLERLTQIVTQIAESGRDYALGDGFPWTLDASSFEPPLSNLAKFRAIPLFESGDLALQFHVIGGGMAHLRISNDHAAELIGMISRRMTDYRIVTNNEGAPSIDISYGTTVDLKKVKLPFADLPIPDRFCAMVGRIIATWGQFDHSFSLFLFAIHAAMKTPFPRKCRTFRQRADLSKRLVREFFQPYETILTYQNTLIDDGFPLYDIRNLLAHGFYGGEITALGVPGDKAFRLKFSLTAVGDLNGAQEQRSFDYDHLEHIYYTMANLNGRINALISPEQIQALCGSDAEYRKLDAIVRCVVKRF